MGRGEGGRAGEGGGWRCLLSGIYVLKVDTTEPDRQCSDSTMRNGAQSKPTALALKTDSECSSECN